MFGGKRRQNLEGDRIEPTCDFRPWCLTKLLPESQDLSKNMLSKEKSRRLSFFFFNSKMPSTSDKTVVGHLLSSLSSSGVFKGCW